MVMKPLSPDVHQGDSVLSAPILQRQPHTHGEDAEEIEEEHGVIEWLHALLLSCER